MSQFSSHRRSRGRADARHRPQVERLEDRLAMHAGHGHEPPAPLVGPADESAQAAALIDPSDIMLRLVPSVPAHSSLPGAPATLYLDFNGHVESMWGWESGDVGVTRWDDVRTPVFDLDGAAGNFSAEERTMIQEIWQHVAEDFAPFNINVTTVNPGDFANGKALRVAIGGSSVDWYGGFVGGLSFVDTFTNPVVNTAYVFPVELGSTKAIADGISHESGHAFGLHHQSTFDEAGEVIEEYATGTAEKAPLMGNSYIAQRSTWWLGSAHPFGGLNVPFEQDDMAVIARADNGFGYRADDHAGNFAAATRLTQYLGGSFAIVHGIVGLTSDKDAFSFTTTGGAVTLRADVTAVGPNLDLKLELYKLVKPLAKFNGIYRRIALADSAETLNAKISTKLAAGRYYLVVTSHGAYGDVGQYTLSGNVPTASKRLPLLSVPATKWVEPPLLPLFSQELGPINPIGPRPPIAVKSASAPVVSQPESGPSSRSANLILGCDAQGGLAALDMVFAEPFALSVGKDR